MGSSCFEAVEGRRALGAAASAVPEEGPSTGRGNERDASQYSAYDGTNVRLVAATAPSLPEPLVPGLPGEVGLVPVSGRLGATMVVFGMLSVTFSVGIRIACRCTDRPQRQVGEHGSESSAARQRKTLQLRESEVQLTPRFLHYCWRELR